MTAGYRFVIDSSAWIEYFEGTTLGKKYAEIIEGELNIIITPRIVLAEVYSKHLRQNADALKARFAMESFSMPADEDNELYFDAAKIHAELRKIYKTISLADAIVIAVSRRNNAKLVTKDFHQKG